MHVYMLGSSKRLYPASQSDLCTLSGILRDEFGRDPPVYSRAAANSLAYVVE